jgi:hypothetical protein
LKGKIISKDFYHDITSQRGNGNKQYPSDFSVNEIELLAFVKGKTMTSQERLVSLIRAVDHLVNNKIEGDFVECGVWKGGSMMVAATRLLQLKDQDRKLFLFDTFEGMSEPDENDISAVDNRKAIELLEESDKMKGDNVWCYSSLEEVQSNLKSTGYPFEKVTFIKGKVEDTLPEPSIKKIALLRLDTDWYESTRHELETLYDLLVPGGVLILDDYGHWEGCKKAVDEFISKRGLKLYLNRIDYTGRLAIKM